MVGWAVQLVGGTRVTRRGAGWADVAWKDASVGDFGGDGRADLAARFLGGWYVAISRGFIFATAKWATAENREWQAVAAAVATGQAPEAFARATQAPLAHFLGRR